MHIFILDEKKQPSTIYLRVKVNSDEELEVGFQAPPEPSKKPSVQWISSLKTVNIQKGCYNH